MYSDQQFEQLMLQYKQIKNGSIDISHLIEVEDFDSAITLIKQREPILQNCKCIRKYLDLTPDQDIQLQNILTEIRMLEEKNISNMQTGLEELQQKLSAEKKNAKIKNAYNSLAENNTIDIKQE